MADSDNLSQLVGNIEKKEIILPDFQRKFVWTDEDKQRNLVASVLAKMPIGSILLLESNPDEYSSKIIGSRVTIDASGLHGTVKYLLDGQQRITVLTNVFSHIYLNVIQVEAKNRARAIDIYENLNLGGVSLSTFDLIMAKVAKVSQENFGDRMRDAMKEEKSYPEPLLPHDLMWIYKATEKKRKINASIDMGCYIEKDDTINPKYLDAFLNVISLYCNNPKFEAGKYKVDMIKRGKILMLSADQINDNCKRVWEESKDKDKFLGVLRKRFDHLQGDIMKEVNNLLC